MTIKLYEIIVALKVLFKQLYLSVTASNFYYDVYKYYSGYGVKYIFTISALSSMIYIITIFNTINDLKEYLVNNKITERTNKIDYVLSQLPEISYNGREITIEAEEPFYLNDYDNNKFGVIDIHNNLTYKARRKIPIIFTKTSIILFLNNKENFSFYYSQLFSESTKIITKDAIREGFAKIFNKVSTLFIYLGIPFFIFIRFIINIFENFFPIILIYLIGKVFNIDISLKSSIRLAMFSSGLIVLLRPVLVVFVPFLVNFLWILLIWTNILVLIALVKLRKEHYATKPY